MIELKKVEGRERQWSVKMTSQKKEKEKDTRGDSEGSSMYAILDRISTTEYYRQ